ncbi:MAG: NAD(P)-binding protein [Deltaproteobacteria bacterium]|nr:NAD(P)-binding protein [Deltaproteobacteria bacterium]MBW1951863.1 NAD(P)-binding protein [Deltaproteobacteria bacterium]MBW1986557.1 NAD(P)-binding protein [Deltaproteobacteria bacterium]MBW2134511.1 NAD(P)-binding protein [Deltaproteobacteria bacterium]
MRLAVIVTGIPGSVAAYLLSPARSNSIRSQRLPGGHSHTADVTSGGRTYPVDTGFIVFHETTYPNLIEILKRLGVD